MRSYDPEGVMAILPNAIGCAGVGIQAHSECLRLPPTRPPRWCRKHNESRFFSTGYEWRSHALIGTSDEYRRQMLSLRKLFLSLKPNVKGCISDAWKLPKTKAVMSVHASPSWSTHVHPGMQQLSMRTRDRAWEYPHRCTMKAHRCNVSDIFSGIDPQNTEKMNGSADHPQEVRNRDFCAEICCENPEPDHGCVSAPTSHCTTSSSPRCTHPASRHLSTPSPRPFVNSLSGGEERPIC